MIFGQHADEVDELRALGLGDLVLQGSAQGVEVVLVLVDEAETHLQQAQSLDSAGKTSEALREYQEIYRTYPNPITAAKIRQLEAQPR